MKFTPYDSLYKDLARARRFAFGSTVIAGGMSIMAILGWLLFLLHGACR